MQICNITTLSLISIGFAVIQGPSVVIYQPNEGPVELTCMRNTSAGSTGWSMNDGPALTLSGINNGALPGHTVNGLNLVIVNATNNTQYRCWTIQDNADDVPSDPVTLYIAGMLYHNTSHTYICM